MNRKICLMLLISVMVVACGGGSDKKVVAPVVSQSDSLAYIIGLNVAENLMKMDSTINYAVVCRAISDKFSKHQMLTDVQARDYYLRYLTYVVPERKRGYEEQFLSDLAKSDRTFTRSKSGLTYTIDVIGDEEFTPRNSGDLISLRYTIKRVDGSDVYSSYERGDTLQIALRDMNDGLSEASKFVGKGGKYRAWVPSNMAYGEAGDEELEVEPFETLFYEVEIVDVERNAAVRSENRTDW